MKNLKGQSFDIRSGRTGEDSDKINENWEKIFGHFKPVEAEVNAAIKIEEQSR